MAQVRANWLKLIVGEAKRQPPEVRDAFFAAFPTQLRAEIRSMGMLSWVEADRFGTVVRVVHDALGPEGGSAFWRTTMADSVSRPLLRPLRDGALGMFGKSPASLFRFSRQAWSLVTRDLCTVRFQLLEAADAGPGESGGRVHFEGLAPEVDPAAFSLFGEGAASAVVQVLGFEGGAHVSDAPALDRQVLVDVRWSDVAVPMDSTGR